MQSFICWDWVVFCQTCPLEYAASVAPHGGRHAHDPPCIRISHITLRLSNEGSTGIVWTARGQVGVHSVESWNDSSGGKV